MVEIVDFNPRVSGNTFGWPASYPTFQLYRENNQAFSGIFAYFSNHGNAVVDGVAEPATELFASAEIHQVLGIPPALGRLLNRMDDTPQASPVAILSHEYWQRQFHGDPAVIGKTVELDRKVVTIVGVTPATFRGIELGRPPDLTLPIGSIDLFRGRGFLADAGNRWLRIVARLRSGVSVQEAQAFLDPLFRRTLDTSGLPARVAARLRPILDASRLLVHPASDGGFSVFRQQLDRPLQILMGLVSFILLIACANLSSLLFSWALARRREFGVRLALGAGGGRLARQVVAETLLLSAFGGALGFVLAQWAGPVFLKMGAGEIGLRAVDLKPSFPVLLFTGAISLVTGLFVALGPLLRVTRMDPQAALRDLSGNRYTSQLARILIPSQVALSVVLLIAAGLFLQTLHNLRHVDTGFRGEHLVKFAVSPGMAGFSADRTRLYLNDVLARLERLPGIQSLTVSLKALGEGAPSQTMVEARGFESTSTMERQTGRNYVGFRFVETFGLTLLRGRDFMPVDTTSPQRVGIVNESFARHFFGSTDAIGKRFAFFGQPDYWYEVVGVVNDARDGGFKVPPQRMVYTLYSQQNFAEATITLRAEGTSRMMTDSVLKVTKEVNPAVRVYDVQTVRARMEASLRRAARYSGHGVWRHSPTFGLDRGIRLGVWRCH